MHCSCYYRVSYIYEKHMRWTWLQRNLHNRTKTDAGWLAKFTWIRRLLKNDWWTSECDGRCELETRYSPTSPATVSSPAFRHRAPSVCCCASLKSLMTSVSSSNSAFVNLNIAMHENHHQNNNFFIIFQWHQLEFGALQKATAKPFILTEHEIFADCMPHMHLALPWVDCRLKAHRSVIHVWDRTCNEMHGTLWTKLFGSVSDAWIRTRGKCVQ